MSEKRNMDKKREGYNQARRKYPLRGNDDLLTH
jgi:hypothetical protein